ncbi:MAG: HD domain-containing phosphohydrolase [Candidatus Omnitrophota bacterium]
MKKFINSFFRSFRAKITLTLILCVFLTGVINLFLIHKITFDSAIKNLRNRLMIIAQTSTLMVDADLLMQIPLNRDGVNTAQFKTVVDVLKKIKDVIPSIKYIYILTKTGQQGIWRFIVDFDSSVQGKKEDDTAYPGDKYDASRFPEMIRGYEQPSADKKLEVDEWGVTLSGYAPIRDKSGKSVAMLGVDMMADDVYAIQKTVDRQVFFVLILGIILSALLGILISRRITGPIKKLVEGTGHISEGELSFRIEVKGNDEISELAKSFNQMTASLFESRKKLVTYFYRMVQSLIRTLEARDTYTRGHSERVADYAGKIASKMGFSQKKLELLREVTLLHDIGKIGVQEGILNKKEKLTEQDWEEIRKHPVIGEDILRPIFLDKEMLEIVRCHHERYDGKGYPDKIKGENINILTAIVSVADAYDAMTSSRAYRPALSRETAIQELIKNKGSQFNPQVVDVFIQILQEPNS